jgi:hypothetical protein
MQNTLTFNTRRVYGPRGQRIAARVIGYDEFGDAVVAMADVDRNISGAYITRMESTPTAADVLRAYDADDRADFNLRESLGALSGDPIFAELEELARAI